MVCNSHLRSRQIRMCDETTEFIHPVTLYEVAQSLSVMLSTSSLPNAFSKTWV